MIDVIIPTWNCETTLKEALDSLVVQDVSKINVIVVDDAWPTEAIKEICEHHPLSIKYIRNDQNVGCGLSRQVGYDNSRAEYVYFMDADDVMMPGAIQAFVDNINGEDYIYSGFLRENTNGSHTHMYSSRQCWVHGMLYKRAFLDEYGIRFNDTYRKTEDSAFNVIVYELARSFKEIDHPAILWQNNPTSITRCTNTYTKDSLSEWIASMLMSYEHILKYKAAERLELPTMLMTYIASTFRTTQKPITSEDMQNILSLYRMGFKAVNEFWFMRLIEKRIE